MKEEELVLVAYGVRMGMEVGGYWGGLWNKKEIADNVAQLQPKSQLNHVVPLYAKKEDMK